jgi:hypothetical protein
MMFRLKNSVQLARISTNVHHFTVHLIFISNPSFPLNVRSLVQMLEYSTKQVPTRTPDRQRQALGRIDPELCYLQEDIRCDPENRRPTNFKTGFSPGCLAQSIVAHADQR